MREKHSRRQIVNLAKIGKFIAEQRKLAKLTQAQLAEKLNITDRAVSKWETGRALPDSSIMLELCAILNITVNDLLNGEVTSVEDYKKEMEKNLLAMVEQKQQHDKQLLALEWVIGILSVLVMLVPCFLAAYLQMEDWLRILLIVGGFVFGLVGFMCALLIEQTAGYYKCAKCGNTHVPTFNAVLWALHYGRTRYMKCPKCGKWSWQKKVVEKD